MARKTKRKLKSHPFKVKDAVEVKIKDEIDEDEIKPAPLPWLTVETLLYGAILILALTLRFWRLGAYPLSDVEATQSLVALLLSSDTLPEPSYYSPLLVSLNALSFLFFGTSDASARLASVLLGSALVILPFTLRRQLGSLVCLIVAALLAISPSAVYLSRTLNSEIGVAVGALMIVSGFFNWIEAEKNQQAWLLLLAGGVALLLTAGSMAYSILIVFGLIILFRFSAFKALWKNAPDALPDNQAPSQEVGSEDVSPEARLSPSNSQPLPSDSRPPIPNPSVTLGARTELEEETSLQSPIHRVPSATKGSAEVATTSNSKSTMPKIQNLQSAGIFFLVILTLLATTAIFNLSGFSILTTSFLDWLSRFSFQPRSDAGFNAVFLLTIYEPFLIFSGLIGLAFVIVRGKLVPIVFGGWFGGILVIDMLMAGRPNGNIILLIVPLAFLAAFALAELWESIQKHGAWNNEGILLATGLAIFAFSYIGLTGWLTRPCGSDDLTCNFAWLQSVAALVLFLTILVFFWYISDGWSVLRGAALVAVIIGLLSVISIGWRLNYGPLMRLAYQPLAGIPASTQLEALTDTLADQSARRVGDETLLDTSLIGVNSPALRWRLRNYRHLTQANTLTESAVTSAIITPVSKELSLNESYVGQDFALNAAWSPVGLQPKELINWLIYRQADELAPGNRAVLWLRLEER